MSRFLLQLAGAALLISPVAPPPVVAAAPGAGQDRHSPVRCRQVRDEGEYRSRPMPMYAPPPPAPAPMPSPLARTFAPPASGITGNLVYGFDGPRVIAPKSAPYGAPGNTERYDGRAVASIQSTASQPVSTFSVDVDTGAYANVRRFLQHGQAVPSDAVRTEEMINYFRYDYPRPQSRAVPFSVTTDVARTPWNQDTRLLRIGLRGYDVDASGRPPANLVFLVDVSGSMSSEDKLPLVKRALTLLADRLTAKDRVSIVVYAGAAGVVLEPTSSKHYVKAALDCLEAGGSTAGGAGIKLAYDLARASYVKGGINRILLATDGDFNVGVSDNKMLEEMVKREREDGITLTTLGFGQGNYNEAMMERIADVGNGNYAYIDSAMEAQKVLDDELSATLFTIAGDVKVQVEFNPAQVKEYRLIGYENRALAEEDFANDVVDAGDIGAGHQVTALYEVVLAGGPGWLPERRYAESAPANPGTPEAAYVKLRYKLPGEKESRLITRPVPIALLRDARAPVGDMAFVTAVAAFGQRLRGDKYLNGFTYPQIQSLAGSSSDYWRGEFGKLVRLASAQMPAQASRD